MIWPGTYGDQKVEYSLNEMSPILLGNILHTFGHWILAGKVWAFSEVLLSV